MKGRLPSAAALRFVGLVTVSQGSEMRLQCEGFKLNMLLIRRARQLARMAVE